MGAVYSTFVTLIRPISFWGKRRTTPQWVRIPDNLAHWPWPRAVNPHMEECSAASDAWLQSFNVFSPKAQAAFSRCQFGLLASLGYPTLNKDGCRVACDLMNLFFVFDEKSDISDEYETRAQADCIMDALRNPYKPRPPGEWIGGTITQQFWQNAIKTGTPLFQQRFISYFERYTDAVVQQSRDRGNHCIRNIKSYFPLRRDTIGTLPSFAAIELHFNIPDHVMNHPTIQRMTDLCTDMVSIGNDLYSYDKEQSRDDADHNLVTVVMKEKGLSLQETYDWIGRYHDDVADEFLRLYKDLPPFPDESEQVNREIWEYVYGLGNWVRTNECWSFESGRYFGSDGQKIIENGMRFALLPRKKVDHSKTFNPTVVAFSSS
ncbi:terpenoid synthase [Immersiella caudata]|uniref:Terpene synthase n=1 Tax=Immersiella caudata TaxID=314043 RepID=A0AA39WWS0_9PEZI|nr:terpenoid synthase [Immersiella caudata]